MRLGIVTSSYPTSPADSVNAGVFVRDLAWELAARGCQVHVITPQKPEPISPDPPLQHYIIPWPARERDLASASIGHPGTALRYAILVVQGLRHVTHYARQHRLDALLAMWAIPSGLFAWRAWRQLAVPYGVWALGSDIWGRDKYPFGSAIVRRVLRDAAFCFADGVQLARDAAELAGRACTFVPSVRRLRAAEVPQVQLPPAETHFLYIGRYERNKGPDILVEAMRQLVDRGADAHLHMFGVGSLEPLLRERVRGYEHRIALQGYADPPTAMAYMQACDWLVIPSRIESIPLIFVDALHMRLPVIATAVGDLGELVAGHSVGLVVAPQDPGALAEAMGRAMDYRRGDYADALAQAALHFDLARSAAQCYEALRSATGRSS